jgi:hypothetical protein
VVENFSSDRAGVPTDVKDPVTQDRVGEDASAADLHEDGRVTDKRQAFRGSASGHVPTLAREAAVGCRSGLSCG